jgi:hypothetical protein
MIADSDALKPRAVTAPTEVAILHRVRGTKSGSGFKPADFMDLASRAAVDQALKRLAAKGILRRLGRGVYDLPQVHPLLGLLLPTPDTLRGALERYGFKLRFQPSGAYSANLLGLTEQVPTRVVLLTDGASKVLRVGRLEILLRHTTPKNMQTAGRFSGLVIQVLRHLGRAQVDAEVLAALRQRLTPEKKACLLLDVRLAPAWIATIMRALAVGE